MGFTSTPIQARTVVRQEVEPANNDLIWVDTSKSPSELNIYDSTIPGWRSVAQVAWGDISNKPNSTHTNTTETITDKVVDITGGEQSGENFYYSPISSYFIEANPVEFASAQTTLEFLDGTTIQVSADSKDTGGSTQTKSGSFDPPKMLISGSYTLGGAYDTNPSALAEVDQNVPTSHVHNL